MPLSRPATDSALLGNWWFRLNYRSLVRSYFICRLIDLLTLGRDTKYWICQRTLIDMVGPVRSISFSFDGSYIVGGSDEGSGLEIAHVETGEYVQSVKTSGPSPVVAWHPSRYHLAYTDIGGLKIIGVDPERK
jgi:WD40 repeat protein